MCRNWAPEDSESSLDENEAEIAGREGNPLADAHSGLGRGFAGVSLFPRIPTFLLSEGLTNWMCLS
jgi:hypothetical protein